jgi:hypothetical protein
VIKLSLVHSQQHVGVPAHLAQPFSTNTCAQFEQKASIKTWNGVGADRTTAGSCIELASHMQKKAQKRKHPCAKGGVQKNNNLDARLGKEPQGGDH